MKRFLALLMTLLAFGATGCTASNEDFYQQAQRYLGAGYYESATRLFDQLGGYADSTEYALYAAGLYALQQGNTELARHSLQQVDPFLNSGRYLTYLDAADLAAADELEAAMALYTSLGAFADSANKAAELQAAIPARDIRRAQSLMSSGGYEQAQALLLPYQGSEEADALLLRCEQGITQAAYDDAADLYANGHYDEALAAFEALGDTLDAQARVLTCRSALYSQAEEDFASVSMDTCEELMARYADMDGYLDSNARLAQLQSRFATNLALRDAAHALPYAVYGSYPTEESGASQLLLWRVLGVNGNTATLLCESVIDALPAATATDLDFGPEAIAALPDQEQLSLLADLSCMATPYAIAQGVQHHSDGRAWWWLADQPTAERHAIVWYNGSILTGGVAGVESTVGVRPLIYLNLNSYAFTKGSGTEADPFR